MATAARKRWAAHRAAKANGTPVVVARRRGRPPKNAPAVTLGNAYLDMTVLQLVQVKRQIDEAWNTAMQLFRRA